MVATLEKIEVVIKVTDRVVRNGVKTVVFDAYQAGGFLGSFSGPDSTFDERLTKSFDPAVFNVVVR